MEVVAPDVIKFGSLKNSLPTGNKMQSIFSFQIGRIQKSIRIAHSFQYFPKRIEHFKEKLYSTMMKKSPQIHCNMNIQDKQQPKRSIVSRKKMGNEFVSQVYHAKGKEIWSP